ncbi:MAG TPA: DUF2177 family protein [Bacteroidales bacterium]
MITKILVSYILTTVVFLIIDLIWLGFIAKNLYSKHLGHLLSPDVNWTAAIVFYLLFIVGISIFAIYPAIESNSWEKALLLGALFGFFTYATYDLTNYATLKNWPLNIVIIDIIWGSFLTASVSLSGFFITRYIQAY